MKEKSARKRTLTQSTDEKLSEMIRSHSALPGHDFMDGTLGVLPVVVQLNP